MGLRHGSRGSRHGRMAFQRVSMASDHARQLEAEEDELCLLWWREGILRSFLVGVIVTALLADTYGRDRRARRRISPRW